MLLPYPSIILPSHFNNIATFRVFVNIFISAINEAIKIQNVLPHAHNCEKLASALTNGIQTYKFGVSEF